MTKWKNLHAATQAVASAPLDLATGKFNALSDRRIDAVDKVVALGTPGADWLAEQRWIGADLTVDVVRQAAARDGMAL
jgi:hypothetical protein